MAPLTELDCEFAQVTTVSVGKQSVTRARAKFFPLALAGKLTSVAVEPMNALILLGVCELMV
jgi:hypothetical protein